MNLSRKAIAAVVATVLLLGGAAALHRFALPGFSSARPEPSRAEIAVANWLLRHSVPDTAARQRNPLGNDPADVSTGGELFRKSCEICHGYDGAGNTPIGSAEFPRAPALKSLLPSISDGEVFYHIRNGIRNTGMPAWTFPDSQVWQLVLYVRHLPMTAPMQVAADQSGAAGRHYMGSESCKGCHAAIYERWKTTPMANVVRDPHASS
jgi:mono/diheme cytochrome c family protein